jgi:hypothetical protein
MYEQFSRHWSERVTEDLLTPAHVAIFDKDGKASPFRSAKEHNARRTALSIGESCGSRAASLGIRTYAMSLTQGRLSGPLVYRHFFNH